MKPFAINIGTMVARYYLMILITVIAGFSGQWWIAIFSLLVFLSAVLGIRFGKERTDQKAEVYELRPRTDIKSKAG